MPHGVVPPAQLFCVPSTTRPTGSSVGAQERVAGGGPGERERRLHGDPAVVAAVADVGPRAARGAAAQLDDGEAVGGHRDALLLGERRRVGRRREHDGLVGVLVVDDREGAAAAAAVHGKDVEVVAVVAELLLLRGGALVRRVELGGVREQRVAPADDGLPRPALRHRHGIHGGGDRGRWRRSAGRGRGRRLPWPDTVRPPPRPASPARGRGPALRRRPRRGRRGDSGRARRRRGSSRSRWCSGPRARRRCRTSARRSRGCACRARGARGRAGDGGRGRSSRGLLRCSGGGVSASDARSRPVPGRGRAGERQVRLR